MSKYTCVDIYTHPQTFLPPSFFSIWLLSVSSTYNTWFVFILTICRSRKWISVFPCQFGHYQFQAISPPLFVRLAAAAGRFLSFVSIWLYFIYINMFLFFSTCGRKSISDFICEIDVLVSFFFFNLFSFFPTCGRRKSSKTRLPTELHSNVTCRKSDFGWGKRKKWKNDNSPGVCTWPCGTRQLGLLKLLPRRAPIHSPFT